MIEIFRNTNYDFLGKKWICIGLSFGLLLLGVASIVWRAVDGNPNTHPFNLRVDFTGGTIVNAKFKQKPDPDVIRADIEKQGIDGSKITIQPVGEEIGQAPKNEVLIRLPNVLATDAKSGESVVAGQQKIRKALETLNDPAAVAQNKIDINIVGRDGLRDALRKLNPLNLS